MNSTYTDNPFKSQESYRQMPYHLIKSSAFANQPAGNNFSRGGVIVTDLITQEQIENKIYLIRGKKVMLDKDLAELYRIQTGRLNEQVKRNIKRFPDDFMFQLSSEEVKSLRSQFAILKDSGRGRHSKYLPFAFTENGVAMLSGVLNSDRAIEVNIQIMRTFTMIRRLIDTHKEIARRISELDRKYEHHDFQIQKLFDKVREIPLLREEKISKIKGFVKD